MRSSVRVDPRALLHATVVLIAGLLFSATALAAGQPFERAAFEAAQKAGRPILLAVHADWCATCRAQEPVLESLLREPKHAGFVAFRVDFDRQKEVVRRLRVQYQSTLIVYKGSKEVARSTAVTDEAAIAAQLAKAL
jgi:thioredoxin-like negative regulator of GroEL